MSAAPAKKAKMDSTFTKKCVDTVRVLSAEMPSAANSGHPGAPMGCAPLAHVLYSQVMRYNPSNPKWINRDRFVLSNGHACALLYSMLYLTGYERPTMEDLKKFRQMDSVTAGHPENTMLDGVEVATGPLGQGISQAVGMAMGEAHLAANFNKEGHEVIDNHTFVICGDGCLQEGVSSEASSLAGHLGLGKLIVLYDDNHITIDGDTELSFTEDVCMRYQAYGWDTSVVADGNDIEAVQKAVLAAKAVTNKPTLIKIRTVIGQGSVKEGTAGVHGAPLGKEDMAQIKTKFGMDPTKHFHVDEDVLAFYREQKALGEKAEQEWQTMFESYKTAFPSESADLERRFKGELPADWEKCLPTFTPADGSIASRNSSEKVLNAVAALLPEMCGGSADLTGSNKTAIKGAKDFQAACPEGRYFRFGVREHAMSAICNGLAAYGGFIPFCATFLNFAGYALGAMRLSALEHFRVLYVMTHDSIGLGEDGPTHQPVGMLLSLRSIPNFFVYRPADANEVAGCYKMAVETKDAPSLFSLSRQNLPCLENSSIEAVAKGAYTVLPVEGGGAPKIIIVATGSEVYIAVDAAKLLTAEGVATAVVSMPCWELFDMQTLAYKQEVFPKDVPVISLEAASKQGWSKYSHYQLGLDYFGKSGPMEHLYEHFGFTGPKVAAKAKGLIAHFESKTVPFLMDLPQLD